LSKGKDGTIDLDAPLATSAGRPIGNNAAKAALLDATAIEKTRLSINKCLADVSLALLIRDKKTDEIWATLLKRKEEKIKIKKHKEDFSMSTTSTVGMDPRTLATHNYYKGMILDGIHAKILVAEATAATLPPEAAVEPAGVLATTSASTPASASALASASASPMETMQSMTRSPCSMGMHRLRMCRCRRRNRFF
jgi:hypothetical protein